jgi:UDP-sugar diphosphatase
MSLLFAFLLAIQPPADIRFTILHTNDEHSAFVPTPALAPESSRGGMARLATAIRTYRERNELADEPLILVSSGDFSTGTPFNWLMFGGMSPELQFMLDLEYDLVVLGNHEFDYGPDPLADYLTRLGYPARAADLPVLSANIRIPVDHPLAGTGITGTHVVTVAEGVKVGFIGLMGMEAADVAPFKDPVSFDDAIETARAEAARLKAEGVAAVVAVTHSGVLEDRQLAAAVPDIALIVGGHSHTLIEEPIRVGETLIVQAGSSLSHLGVLDVALDVATGRIRLLNGERGLPYVVPLDPRVASDSVVQAQVDAYTAELDRLLSDWSGGRITAAMQVLATAGFDLPNTPELQETPMGNFVTDAMRFGVAEVTGAPVDVAFLANGVIRGAVAAGPVPFYDIASNTGLGSGPDFTPGYPLVSVYLTGTELRRVLEITLLLSHLRGDMYYLQVSGLRYEYDIDRMIWGRVPFSGTPVPATKAVMNAWRMTPEGEVPLDWDDGRLYHVVSDYYNASFLPYVGTILPQLKLEFKDESGNPADIDGRIVRRDGRPYKVWQAVAEHAMREPSLPSGYALTFQRQIPVDGPSLWRVPLTVAGVLVGTMLAVFGGLARRRRLRQGMLVWMLLSLWAGPVSAQSTTVIRRIEPILHDPVWDRSTWGIAVMDLGSGAWVFRENAQKLLMPASNTKLFTSAAALELLGPDHRFTTTLTFTGTDLVVTGGGDPVLGGRFTDGDRTRVFRQWADSLASAGITRIPGRVLAEVSRYDDLRLGRSWSWDYTTYWFAAELSALNFNDNCVDLVMVGGRPGEPATITWEPFNTDYVQIVNETMTVRRGEPTSTRYERPWGTNLITVGNRIAAGDTVRYSVAVHQPALYAAHVLRRVLTDAGIAVDGGIGFAEGPAQGRVIARHASPALRDIVRVINKRSQNLYADAVMKELALSDSVMVGSHAEGIARANHLYATAGIDTSAMRQADGSGLSRVNLIAPDMTVALLRHMHAHPDSTVRRAFIESLPYTGEPGNPLGAMFRARNAPFVQAKTGTIGYARALSGYLRTQSGRTYAFSFMVNHHTEPNAAANRLIEAVLAELAKD